MSEQRDHGSDQGDEGGVTDALANDWEQTKSDLPGLEARTWTRTWMTP